MVRPGPAADWGVTMVEWGMATYGWPPEKAVWEVPIQTYFALQGAYAGRNGNKGHQGLGDRASIRARREMEARIRRDFDVEPEEE